MFTFNFSSKKKKSKSNKQNVSKEIIIERNVNAIISIDLNGEMRACTYKFDFCNAAYKIAKECYTCKGQEHVFRLAHPTKVKMVWSRSVDNRGELNINYWLPFYPGVSVIGNVVSRYNVEYFIIKTINIFDINNINSINEYNNYKEHKQEIDKILIARQNG